MVSFGASALLLITVAFFSLTLAQSQPQNLFDIFQSLQSGVQYEPVQTQSISIEKTSVSSNRRGGKSSFVYARTNNPFGSNEIVAYRRSEFGVLKEIGRFKTYGNGVNGTVDPLGSQDSLIFSPDKKYILSVNGGSNTISIHKRNPDGRLKNATVISSFPFSPSSSTPVSLTAWKNIVYVMHVGQSTSISGFKADWKKGQLTLLPGSQSNFSGNYGDILISPNGKFLVLTGKRGDRFRVFPLDNNFVPTGNSVITNTSTGRVPFAIVFDKTGKYLLVALAFGGFGSWSLNSDGTLTLVQEFNTSSAATCWVTRNANSNYVYAINAGKESISGFTMNTNGTFNRLSGKLQTSATVNEPDLVLFSKGSTPLDATTTTDGKYLYVILGGRGTISGFEIEKDGNLFPRGENKLAPAFSGINGIIAD